MIKKAFNTFSFNHHVIKEINKKAYLSSLAISDYIIVTCDSTSMISEAAVTGKPVYVAMMKPKEALEDLKVFFSQFNKLGITKELGDSIDSWSYDKLDEINRIAPLIKQRMKKMELFKSLEVRTKVFNDPFKHFEINKPLTQNAIDEICNAKIADPRKQNLNYDGTRALDGGEGALEQG